MNGDSLLRKFKISMSKYLEYKYDIDCEFHQFIIEDKIRYSLCTLNGDWLRSHIHIVEKDINKYWNSFVKAYKNNNYKKAYRICKYIRKIAKSYNYNLIHDFTNIPCYLIDYPKDNHTVIITDNREELTQLFDNDNIDKSESGWQRIDNNKNNICKFNFNGSKVKIINYNNLNLHINDNIILSKSYNK